MSMSLRKFKSATVTTATVIAGLFSATAFATSEGVDTAQVISASPIYERVTEPRQECSEAPAAQPKERSVIAPILGGLAGALIGRQVGHGNGRDVATAVGAAAGIALTQRYVLPKADGALRLGALRFHPEGVLAVASGLRGSYTVASIGF